MATLRTAIYLAAFIVLVALPGPVALAQPPRALHVDLTEKSIDITTGFDGARLTVYGTRKEPGDIAIAVRGPAESMVVRRKQNTFGVWMNRQSVVFDAVPSYYDIALSRTESDIAPLDTRHRYDIGVDAMQFDTREEIAPQTRDSFREALIRNRQAAGLLPLEPKSVNFISSEFFRADFYFPSNVPTGIYRVRAFLIRDGEIVESNETEIKVAQNGFSASVFLFAKTQSLAYGVICVMVALFFGWGAYAVMRRE